MKQEINIRDFEDRQKRIYNNKVKHEFNIKDPYQEVRYILEEVAELMRAIERDDKANIKEELADIVIFSYGLAEICGLGSLDREIFRKMEINENREYTRNKEGDFKKVEEH